MIRIFTILVIFLLFSSTLNSQDKSIIENYKSYFDNEAEVFFLHLNKTNFIIGEEIWFQGYIMNHSTGKPHTNTKNLYCSIYDKEGTLKEEKLFYVENGITRGSFLIDSTYLKEKYYVVATTQRMYNMNEDQSFIQEINIINNYNNDRFTDYKDQYDIQFLPEGGHILVDVKNNIGLVVKKNGLGVKLNRVEILDNEDNYISFTTTNDFGLGKFKLKYNPFKTYKAKIVLSDGKVLLQNIPRAKKIGVVLNLKDYKENFFKISLKTNNETIKNLYSKKYNLLIHNTKGLTHKEVYFDVDSKNNEFYFAKNDLFEGVNIVTLFDDLQRPISERMFYNYKKHLDHKNTFSISSHKIKKDSLFIKLSLKTGDSLKYHLSASTLPSETNSYNPKTSIVSKFKLSPYINETYIENPIYYFTNINRKKKYELDLLLMTHGWSKFNWSHIFNDKKEVPTHETGITLEVDLNNSEKIKKLYLLNKENNLQIPLKIIDNKLRLENLYLTKNSNLYFIGLDHKERAKKSNFFFREYPLGQYKKNNFNFKKNTFLSFNQETKELSNYYMDSFVNNYINLIDTVTIKITKKVERDILFFGRAKRLKVGENYVGPVFLDDYIRSLGFTVQYSGFNEIFGSVRINSNRFRNNLNTQRDLASDTRLFFNGARIFDNDIISFRDIRMKDIDEIHSTRGIGFLGNEIHIYTKTRKKSYPSKFQKYSIKRGYSPSKEYYTPKYIDTNNSVFKKYGAIHWQTDIMLDSKTDFSVKIPHLNQKSIKLFLEGIVTNGKLISIEKEINID